MSENTIIHGNAGVPPLVPSGSAGETPAEATESVALPKTFRDLALQVIYAIVRDIHIKGSGLIFFGLLGYGALHPANKDQCEQLAALAGTYLCGAAINRPKQ